MNQTKSISPFPNPHNMSLISKVSRKQEGEPNESKDNNNIEVNSERFLEVKNFQIRRKKYGFLARSQPSVKGFTFGSGRDELKQQGILGNIPAFTPGPGQYDFKQQDSQRCFTIGTKTNDLTSKQSLQNPPLGKYEIKGLDRYGYYQNSKNKNACATLFSPPQLLRFNYKNNQNPGPGDYNLPGGINTKGIYYLSNFKTQLGWKIGAKSISFRKNVY